MRKYKNERLAIDRGGTVHILSHILPSKKDPWQRALCGDPGDFKEYNNTKNINVICESCLEKFKKI